MWLMIDQISTLEVKTNQSHRSVSTMSTLFSCFQSHHSRPSADSAPAASGDCSASGRLRHTTQLIPTLLRSRSVELWKRQSVWKCSSALVGWHTSAGTPGKDCGSGKVKQKNLIVKMSGSNETWFIFTSTERSQLSSYSFVPLLVLMSLPTVIHTICN